MQALLGDDYPFPMLTSLAVPPGIPEERQPVSDGRAALPGTAYPALCPPAGHAHPAARDRGLHHDEWSPQVE